jgi:hypothetical protein
VLLGTFNADPADGEARRGALAALLSHPELRDPRPASARARQAAAAEGGVNRSHRSDPAHDTANWRDGPGQAGNLRVDYVLPSRHWVVAEAGVLWPEPSAGSDGEALRLTRHGLVWVELRRQR